MPCRLIYAIASAGALLASITPAFATPLYAAHIRFVAEARRATPLFRHQSSCFKISPRPAASFCATAGAHWQPRFSNSTWTRHHAERWIFTPMISARRRCNLRARLDRHRMQAKFYLIGRRHSQPLISRAACLRSRRAITLRDAHDADNITALTRFSHAGIGHLIFSPSSLLRLSGRHAGHFLDDTCICITTLAVAA